MNYLLRTSLLLGASVFTTGCVLTKWITENEDNIKAGGELAEAAGPWGYIASAARS